MRARLRDGSARLASAALVAAVLPVALTACGASQTAPDATGSGPANGKASVVIAALGDSITSGSPGYDPDPAARTAGGFGDDERSSYEYWAARKDPELEFRNCGVFGQRTDEIAARLDDCASGADALVVQGGINDIAQSLQGGQAASLEAARRAAANIAGMLDRARERGIAVAVADLLPWNNGHPLADRAIAKLNTAIGVLAAERDVPVLPFHDTLADPKRPELMAAALTADGDHPSVAGYRLLGERAFELPRG